MNILIVIPSLSKLMGGGTTSVVNYYRALTEYSDTKVIVVSMIIEGEMQTIDDDLQNNNDFIFFPVIERKWRYSKELNLYLKQEIPHFDLVWIHALWLSHSLFASMYAKKFNVPYIITLHGLLNPYAIKQKQLKKKIYWNLIEKKVFDGAEAVHCLSNFEASVVKEIGKESFVIPNVINTGSFISKSYSNLKTICFIGRFHHKKGLDLLLEALTKIENIQLLVAGEGEDKYEEYIYGLVKTYDLENRVKFFGFADEALQRKIYKESLFCVIPSHSEGLAMVGLESLAHSTPVLATAQCDFEIISEYAAGMVIENNQPEVIREGIKNMMKKDMERMSKNAHHLAKENFDLEVVAKRLLEQFELIVK